MRKLYFHVLVQWFTASLLRNWKDRNSDEYSPYKKTWRNQSSVITARLANKNGNCSPRDVFPSNQSGRLSCH